MNLSLVRMPFLAFLLLSLTSCSASFSHIDDRSLTVPFSSTRITVDQVGRSFYNEKRVIFNPIRLGLSLLDLPISLVTDTLFLPHDIINNEYTASQIEKIEVTCASSYCSVGKVVRAGLYTSWNCGGLLPLPWCPQVNYLIKKIPIQIDSTVNLSGSAPVKLLSSSEISLESLKERGAQRIKLLVKDTTLASNPKYEVTFDLADGHKPALEVKCLDR